MLVCKSPLLKKLGFNFYRVERKVKINTSILSEDPSLNFQFFCFLSHAGGERTHDPVTLLEIL